MLQNDQQRAVRLVRVHVRDLALSFAARVDQSSVDGPLPSLELDRVVTDGRHQHGPGLLDVLGPDVLSQEFCRLHMDLACGSS